MSEGGKLQFSWQLHKVLTSSGAGHLTTKELQSGWLTKLGGIHKNWKKRWFTIRGSHMVYFKDQHVGYRLIEPALTVTGP